MVFEKGREVSVLLREPWTQLYLTHVWGDTGDVFDGLSSPTNLGDYLRVGESGESCKRKRGK